MNKLLIVLGFLALPALLGVTNNLHDHSTQEAVNKALEQDELNIARGDVEGFSNIHKFGSNPDIDTGTDPEDVWDHDSVYVFPTLGVTHYISSSSAADTTITDSIQIEIQGLDSLWASQIDTVTVAGQTKTEIADTKWVRIFRARNIGGVAFAGSVYVYEDVGETNGVPNVNAQISAVLMPAHQQTMMAIYTIPLGKTGYMLSWYVGAAKSTGSNMMYLQVRTFGGVFRTQDQCDVYATGTSAFRLEYPIPRAYGEKTDIRVRVQQVSADNTGLSAGFDIVLVDNA